MMLCNDGGTEAFKVQIREIRFKSGIAEFSEIPQIRHGHRSAVTIYISAPEEGKEAPYGVYDLELLMVEEIKNRAETSDLSPLETKCDIFYEDYSKRRFTTQATLSHNIVRGLTVAKNYSFYELQLAKPQSRFRKWMKLRCLC